MPSAAIVAQTRRGKGNALVCGFAAATGDIVVMFDADGSADPDEIARYVAALTDGADFAKGSRVMPGGGSEDITVLRGLGNRGLTWFTNRLFRTGFSNLSAVRDGLRVLRTILTEWRAAHRRARSPEIAAVSPEIAAAELVAEAESVVVAAEAEALAHRSDDRKPVAGRVVAAPRRATPVGTVDGS
jgi:glycosyltransferase involved in cell wall biosynthesis